MTGWKGNNCGHGPGTSGAAYLAMQQAPRRRRRQRAAHRQPPLTLQCNIRYGGSDANVLRDTNVLRAANLPICYLDVGTALMVGARVALHVHPAGPAPAPPPHQTQCETAVADAADCFAQARLLPGLGNA